MWNKYKSHFSNKNFAVSVAASITFLIFSLVINYFANIYVTETASNPVTDIVLSNTRVYDVDGIFTYGPILVIFLIALLCIVEPKRSPFVIKSVALFILIRSIFISLTHIGPFPSHIVVNPASFISHFTFGPDLFFSGHTGIPFLMALIFWDEFWTRITFIVMSVVFGVVVLLGHLHYTIDVASAFFITYTIFHISMKLFPKDHMIFFNGVQGG
ncbi:MAG: hypothetical protein HY226_04510 [Candidatus Vogelbacteria bacterium]|nr:hypothetical protein [Candidatus Vogelbacteria bacterium]